MASDLSLPVPVLIHHQQSGVLDVLIKNILVDLGYPQDLIALTASFEEAKTYISQHLPNLIFCSLGPQDDAAAIRTIRSLHPSANIVSIHMPELPQQVTGALQSGANAYLLQNTPANEMFEQIKVILRGGAALHPQLAQYLLKTSFSTAAEQPGRPQLSPAEYRILQRAAQSVSLHHTALALEISDYQVDALIKNILRKLVHTAAQT